jgi:heptosyltransferase-1
MSRAEQKKKVLFVRFSAYGDILMCAPALQHYIQTHPQDEVHVLLSPQYAEVLGHLSGVHQFHYYTPQRNWRRLDEYLRCAIELSAERFDTVFDWQANSRSRLLVTTIRPRSAYSFNRHARKHQFVKCLSSMLEAGIEPPGMRRPLRVCSDEDIHWAEKLLAQLPRDATPVALGLGGLWETKLWPLDYYAAVIEILKRSHGCYFFLMGRGVECERTSRLMTEHRDACRDLCDKVTMGQASAVVYLSELTISNDTSVMHLGWVQGRKTIGIFGATDPIRTGPRGDNTYAFSTPELPCHPCFSGRCRLPRLECLLRITPEEVAKRALTLLAKPDPSR